MPYHPVASYGRRYIIHCGVLDSDFQPGVYCLTNANRRAELKIIVCFCADTKDVAMIFIPIMYCSTDREVACGRNYHHFVLTEIHLTHLAKLHRRNDAAVIVKCAYNTSRSAVLHGSVLQCAPSFCVTLFAKP